MLQVGREACRKTCCFSRLLFFAESLPRAAAREEQPTGRFSPINSCLDTVLPDCAQHLFICWYVVAEHTSPQYFICPDPPPPKPSLLSLPPSCCPLASLWKRRQKGRSRSGCGLRCTSVLEVGLQSCRENAPQRRHREEWKKKARKCQPLVSDFCCAGRAGGSQMLAGYW